MLPRTCEATPSWNRPPESFCRSQAAYAVSIGLRGNATTMLVRTTIRSVAVSISAATVNGSWIVSGTWMTSKPSRSTRCAHGAASSSSLRPGQDATISTR